MTFLDDLSQLLGSLMDALLYPFKMLVLMVRSLLDQLLDPFLSLFDSVYSLFDAVYQFLDSVLSFFPGEWGVLILAAFVFGVALWAYNLITRIT
ncbi:hypothetical protein HWN40_13215 [Methanolobus zinderi]|uniref:Uncharacterized protein n=1 Tax=Methanolobus zinderi TaxID=536044 RepID=A0A7D5ICY0_9EURY|nr:hypothetical protein [Methanolobus zinderi]QLC51109.1 hypothetical protein HWN40_13215 [Methanolobus zinderi]